jgi:hypothetical protein
LSVLALAPLAAGQLTDLQPGRNFPTAASQFGGGRSENIDFGDCDNDGDLDVIVGNGGDGAAENNRIFINRGGLQGGTLGIFTEDTANRFAGVTVDTSRDIEFMDMDNDGDLDIYVSNRGNNVNGGEVSRFYVNLGGLQAGTVGFYQEDTNNRWGNLISVPLNREEGVQDGQGPWRDWSCDCDFGDLDDDGDLDLFHSSYGPSINGTEDSRIFLNDGSGVFDEHWPWIDPGADIRIHTLDIDLADFDGDYDLDVFASSRDSQARVWINNCYDPVGDAMFTDITQTALINNGATLSGSNNYEAEFGDLDGDGDFDVWAKNYNGNTDRILRNNGFVAGVGFNFTQVNAWIKGDPSVDENEVDLLDFDGDGDLDAFAANFSGTNWLYTGGLAQGLTQVQGFYHRNGTTSGGSLASWHELPQFNNSGQSLDGECGDLDNDGDMDIAIANDANQQNRLLLNTLGVPDTHAPTVHQWTDQCDKPLGSNTVIHVQVRDNNNFYMIAYYDVNLFYSVNGGGETQIDMFAQSGQQFRGVIPPQSGTVSYRVEVTDRAGNTGSAGPRDYVQSGSTYTGLGFGLAGTAGVPALSGTGTWEAGTAISIDLTSARPSATAGLFVGLVNNPTSAFGGMLVPVPFFGPFLLATNGAGNLNIQASAPKGIPCGLDIFMQYGINDPASIGGVALSNAMQVTTP